MLKRSFRILFLSCLTRISLQRPQPQAEDWDSLNSTVHGRLVRGVPFARPCYPLSNGTGGVFDPQECKVITNGYINETIRTGVFGAYINTQWETCQTDSNQCLLDAASPANPLAFTPPKVCSQGSVPDYAISVQTAADVMAGFQFSKAHGVNLVIKNTGHDYKGRSSGPGSLALWMHNLQSVALNPTFVPKGCAANKRKPGVTFGAGVSFRTLIDFADIHNITIPTAGDETVAGGGGYLQGGGHSVLTNAFGLAVDRALEFEVVTPSGQHVFANECQFSDLFFALRGGGGGTFGAVLGITTLALPHMEITVEVDINPVREDQSKLIRFMAAHALEFAKSGWGGFTLPLTGVIFVNGLLNPTQAKKSIAPLQQFIQELGGNLTITVESGYKSYYASFTRNVAIGTPFAISSRLVPMDNFSSAEKQEELSSTIEASLDQIKLPILFASTPFLYGDKGGTSVTPEWRSSLWHVTLTDGWTFNSSSSDIAKTYKKLSAAMDPLRRITPGSGGYLNEADVYEPDFQKSFWGDNYKKLLAIKGKYDPDHLLDCWQCVGWRGPTDERYRCYLPE